MSLATFSERVLNGEPIKWADWAELKNITPAQAAKLANRIDPICSLSFRTSSTNHLQYQRKSLKRIFLGML